MDLETLRQRVQPVFAARPTVDVAILFGSVAKGRARPDSDVDIAVVGAGADVLELIVALNDALGRPADVVKLTSQSSTTLLHQIVRHARRLYERERGGYARFISRSLCDLETDRPAIRRMYAASMRQIAEHGLLGTR